MIGNITPPVGVVLMTTCSIEHLSMEQVCKKLWPFLFVLMVEVIILWAFPWLVTGIPNMLMR